MLSLILKTIRDWGFRWHIVCSRVTLKFKDQKANLQVTSYRRTQLWLSVWDMPTSDRYSLFSLSHGLGSETGLCQEPFPPQHKLLSRYHTEPQRNLVWKPFCLQDWLEKNIYACIWTRLTRLNIHLFINQKVFVLCGYVKSYKSYSWHRTWDSNSLGLFTGLTILVRGERLR